MATYNGCNRARSHFAIKRILVDGGAAEAELTATGLGANDAIQWIDHISTKAAIATVAYIDLDEVSIPAANKLSLATTDTTDDQLYVVFIPVDL